MRGVSGRVETTSAKNPEHGSHGGGRAEPHPGNMLAYRSLRGSASSDHLDLVRGAAALLVMLGHLRNLFFVDFSEVASNANPLVKLVYLATGFSHYAVMIFFVLSGFLVGGGVLRGRIDGKWSWSLTPRIG